MGHTEMTSAFHTEFSSVQIALLGSLGFFHDSSKCRFFVYCQVGQYFTVNFNTGFLQTANKAAVRHAVDTRTSIDTLNPQRTELALAVAAVTVRILAGFDNSLFGYTENTGRAP